MACQNAQVFAALETTPGTEETPDAGEVIDYTSITFAEGGGGPINSRPQRAHMHGEAPKVPAARFWNVTLGTEVKAATAAGSAPELANLLKAAGFDETITGGASAAYDLFDDPNAAANDASVTIDMEQFLDGKVFTAFGLRPTMTLNFDQSDGLMAEWSGVGCYKAPADVSALTSATYNAGVRLVNLSDTNPFRLDTGGTPYAGILRSGSIALNWAPAHRPHMGGLAANGYCKWPAWLGRSENVSFSFILEEEDETAFAAWAKRLAATAFVTELNWGAGSRNLQAILRNCVIQNITSTVGTPNTHTLEGTAAHSGTDGPLSLIWT